MLYFEKIVLIELNWVGYIDYCKVNLIDGFFLYFEEVKIFE